MANTIGQVAPTLNGNLIKSCTSCAHAQVCGILRAIAPLMQSFQKDEKTPTPFQATDLATICDNYLSTQLVSMLTEGGA